MPFNPAFIARPIVALSSLAAAMVFAQAAPPVAPVKPVTDTYFGVSVTDPYRYMENMKDADVAAWMKAQADYTHVVLSKIPGRAELYKEVEVRGNAASARVYDVQVVGTKVYYQKRRAEENIGKLYVRDGFGGTERLLIDPDAVKSADGKHSAIDWFVPSPDNKYLGYGMSPGGSEESVLHIIEVATGKPTGDVIDRANFGNPSWLDGNRFVYNRLQKLSEGAPQTDKYQDSRVYVHKLGDDPEKDSVLIGVGVSAAVKLEPADITIVYKPLSSDYMIVQAFNGTQRELRLWTAPVASLNGDKTPWVQVAGFEDEVTDLAISGETVYLMTHKGTPRFKVLRTSLAKPDIAQAATAIAPGEAVVTAVGAAKDALYVRKMNGGNSELFRLEYAQGAKPQQIALPFVGDIEGLALDPRVPGVVFNLGGWVRFGSYYAYDPKSREVTDTRLQPQGKYDNPTYLVATDVKAKAPDGTMIPMSIVHKKGMKLDGTNPTILYGYGAYGIPPVAVLPPDVVALVRSRRCARSRARPGRGRVCARIGTRPATRRPSPTPGATPSRARNGSSQANTRLPRSCRSWAAALVASSSAARSPSDPNSSVLRLMRCLCLMLFGSNPRPMEYRIFRSSAPSSQKKDFKALHAMSPYAWVKDGDKYPAVLLTTGFNDPRVDAWEAGKMAARLQAASTSGKPILLRIDYDAGHGFGSTKKSQYEERTDEFAFLLWQAGAKGFQP